VTSFFWSAHDVELWGAPSSYPWWLFAIGYGGGGVWFLWRACTPPAPPHPP